MSKLQKILVRSRRQVFSEMVGNNPSIFKGEGYDFVELREYSAGDDIRYIDWNITAKMRKPYIKIFKEERELNVVLVCLLNGSVYFGSHKLKQETIAEIAALLGFSVLKNGDLLSSYIFTNEMNFHSKPTKKIHTVQKIVSEVLDFAPLNKGLDFSFIADTLYKRVNRKSVILVVGDFFELPNFRLLAKKHEIICIIVRDKLEENPPLMGFASLVDPQSGAVLEGDFSSSSIEAYKKRVYEHDHKLFEVLKKDGIRFTKIYTDSLPSVELRRLFEGR